MFGLLDIAALISQCLQPGLSMYHFQRVIRASLASDPNKSSLAFRPKWAVLTFKPLSERLKGQGQGTGSLFQAL